MPHSHPAGVDHDRLANGPVLANLAWAEDPLNSDRTWRSLSSDLDDVASQDVGQVSGGAVAWSATRSGQARGLDGNAEGVADV
jgi:hypothetical protein